MARAVGLRLARDGSGRAMPWLIGLMVYLAALALAAFFIFQAAVERWDRGLAGTMTVQLPRPASGAPLAPQRLNAALDAIRAVPGVVAATALDGQAEARLLEPWLGSGTDLDLLPVPQLVDVKLAPGARIDSAGLARQLGAIVPGAVVDGHERWLDRVFATARAFELGALAIVLVIAVVAVLTVGFATRMGLLVHAPAIELLHLIGARDVYVARQFQWHAFRQALVGGVIGVVAAGGSLAAAAWLASGGPSPVELPLIPRPEATPGLVAALLLLPLPVGLIGLVTARWTVLGTLARLP
jgi:cell division transport system permease protein